MSDAPPVEWSVVVVCNERSAFHDRKGRSKLRTFELHSNAAPRDPVWYWIAADTHTRRGGVRPAPVTYLRGNEVAAEQVQVRDASTRGSAEYDDEPELGPYTGAKPEDVAGRAHVELHCRCGSFPSVRVRGERLWQVFDALTEHDQQHWIERLRAGDDLGGRAARSTISLRTLWGRFGA